MKDFYFEYTGEIRIPFKGEYYMSDDGNIYISINTHSTFPKYPIYTRHEIERPANATCLAYHFRTPAMPINKSYGVIELPRPKVKKWIWKCGDLWYTKEHFSEKEIKERSNMPCLSKVEGTEI